MRIGFDITPLTTIRTGVGNYCYYLLKRLLHLGQDCEYVGFVSGPRHLHLEALEKAITYRRLPIPTRVLYQMWSSFGRPRVDKFLGGVDVFHAPNYFLPPTTSARRVVSFHDLAFLAMPQLCSPKIRDVFTRGIRRFAKDTDAILTCSECTKRDIVRLLDIDPEKVTVTYYAVDEGFAPMAREQATAHLASHYGIRPPYILFVGTLEPRKNVPALLEAFALLKKDIPHKVVLVGVTGWNADGIFSTIEKLNLSDRVIHTGFVESHSELAAFYIAADVFVFPSLYEGFGLPILEAMTCGCPVVAADNSSIPEVAGEAAILTEANDVEGIAASIRKVLEDAALRGSLIAKGREQAQRFSWEACARATVDVYKKLA